MLREFRERPMYFTITAALLAILILGIALEIDHRQRANELREVAEARAAIPYTTLVKNESFTPANPNSIGELMKDPDKAYVIQTLENLRSIAETMHLLGDLTQHPDPASDVWIQQMTVTLDEMDARLGYQSQFTPYPDVTVTQSFTEIDQNLQDAREQMRLSYRGALSGLRMGNEDLLAHALSDSVAGMQQMTTARNEMKMIAQERAWGIEPLFQMR